MIYIKYESENDIFPSIIESDRIIFKKFEYGILDIKKLYKKFSNVSEEDTKYDTFTPYESRIEVKEYIDHCINQFENGESASYFMFLKDSDEFIGTTGFEPSWNKSIAESGVFLFREYWGNGYSSERGNVMVELAFEEYDFDYWVSKCHPDNTGSIKAIEKYVVDNGGEKIGILPNWYKNITSPEYDDILFFKLSKKDYLN